MWGRFAISPRGRVFCARTGAIVRFGEGDRSSMATVDGIRFCMLLCLLQCCVTLCSASLPVLSVPSLVPAFIWSNHRWLDGDLRRISYQTLSSQDLAETMKREFVSAEPSRGDAAPVDVVMVFIGKKLRSGDVSRKGESETSDLLRVLNAAVTSSNSSVSLPYVMTPAEENIADVLMTSIVGDLDDSEDSRPGEVITAGPCMIKSVGTRWLQNLDALRAYLTAKKETKGEGKTDLVIVCSSSEIESIGSKSLSEGEVLDEVLWGLDELKTRYVALYATDLTAVGKALPSRTRGRQLGSVIYEDEVFCNEVCQTKALLLEALMVGATLLVILISGLCCMAGITSPSRFEQPKEGQ